MGRKKKEEVLETEALEALEAEAAEESEDTQWEAEAEEAEALAASEEQAEEEKAEKKPTRSRRKKAEKVEVEAKEEESPAPAEEEAPEDVTEEVAAAIAFSEAEQEAPKPRARRSRSRARKSEVPATPENVQQDLEVASRTVHQSMDSMAKQWAAVKDISVAVSGNLERIHKQMVEMQVSYQSALENLSARVPQKPAPITKLAMGFSAVACVLSILSVSFSQSVRTSVLNKELVARAAQSSVSATNNVANNTPNITSNSASADHNSIAMGNFKKHRDFVKTKK